MQGHQLDADLVRRVQQVDEAAKAALAHMAAEVVAAAQRGELGPLDRAARRERVRRARQARAILPRTPLRADVGGHSFYLDGDTMRCAHCTKWALTRNSKRCLRSSQCRVSFHPEGQGPVAAG